ncbi:MAG: hypothetical protein K0R08_1116 [Solimicrobium sp.]|nr:hypothetical protein [Solimicrobium sp.]
MGRDLCIIYCARQIWRSGLHSGARNPHVLKYIPGAALRALDFGSLARVMQRSRVRPLLNTQLTPTVCCVMESRLRIRCFAHLCNPHRRALV